MNEQLQNYARQQIKDGLRQCTEPQVNLFMRMYSHKKLDATIDEAVDAMSEDKLDTAMDQVSRTLAKNSTKQGVVRKREVQDVK
jgi:hypothetical protein